MKLYKLECTNEDGDIETGGYYFNISNAEKAAKELDEIPINKQYGIVYHVVEIETDDSPSPSPPLKQLSDEEIKTKAIEFADSRERGGCTAHQCLWRGYEQGYKDGRSVSPLKEEKTEAEIFEMVEKGRMIDSSQSDHINPIELLEWIYKSDWQRPHSGDENVKGLWVKKAGRLINGIITEKATTNELLTEFLKTKQK